jgi:hypothetical protein
MSTTTGVGAQDMYAARPAVGAPAPSTVTVSATPASA